MENMSWNTSNDKIQQHGMHRQRRMGDQNTQGGKQCWSKKRTKWKQAQHIQDQSLCPCVCANSVRKGTGDGIMEVENALHIHSFPAAHAVWICCVPEKSSLLKAVPQCFHRRTQQCCLGATLVWCCCDCDAGRHESSFQGVAKCPKSQNQSVRGRHKVSWWEAMLELETYEAETVPRNPGAVTTLMDLQEALEKMQLLEVWSRGRYFKFSLLLLRMLDGKFVPRRLCRPTQHDCQVAIFVWYCCGP